MSESSDSDKKSGLISLGSILFVVLIIGRFWVSNSKHQEAEEQNKAQDLAETAQEMHYGHAQTLFEEAFSLDSTATIYLTHTDSTPAFLQAQAPVSRRQLQQAIGIMHQIMDREHGDTTAYLYERASLVGTYFQTKLHLIDLYQERQRPRPKLRSNLTEAISNEAGHLLLTTQKLARLDSVETILAKARQFR